MSADDARTRFAAATQAHLVAELTDEVELRHVDVATWHAEARPLLLESDDRAHINPQQLVPPEQGALGTDLDDVLGPPLIPKLRAGFTITGFEVSPRWGVLVHLRRHLRDALARIHRYRIDGTGAAELRADGLPVP